MSCKNFPLNKSLKLVSLALASCPLLIIQSTSAVEISDFDTLSKHLSQSTGALSLTLTNNILSTKNKNLVLNEELTKVSIDGNGHSIKWSGSEGITPKAKIQEIKLSNLGRLSLSADNQILDVQSGLSNASSSLPLIYQTSGGNLVLEKVVITTQTSAHTGGGVVTFVGQASNTITIDQSAFIQNQSTANYGGALTVLSKQVSFPFKNQTNGFIRNSLFIGNQAISGGALYTGKESEIGNGNANSAQLTIEDSYFEGNSTLHPTESNRENGLGGAIFLSGSKKNHTIKNTSFISNHADQYGGAIAAINADLTIIADKMDVIFSKNSAGAVNHGSIENRGDAIYLKNGKLILKPSPQFKIVFEDSILTVSNTKTDLTVIDINDWRSPASAGEVQFYKRVDNAKINLYGGTLSLLGDENALESSSLYIDMLPATINTVNDHIQNIHLKDLYATSSQGPILLTVDVNLLNKKADTINATGTTIASTNLNVSEWHVLEDNPTDLVIDINLSATEVLFDYLGLAPEGQVAYGDTYKWDVAYIGNGDYQFTRSDQPPEPPEPGPLEPKPEPKPEISPDNFNPDVYGPTIAIATLTHLQHELASNLFHDYTNQMAWAALDEQQPQRKPWWVKVFGGNFDWRTKNYSSIDVKYASAMMGHNFEPQTFGTGSMSYGIYLGGLYGKQGYASRNDIRQNAGFIGAQALYTHNHFWAGIHSNVGLMYNNFKSPSIDKSEKTPWVSVGASTGYAFAMPKYNLVFSPVLTANYVYVDDFEVISKNRTHYRLDNSHSWEVSPEVRLTKSFDNHLKGYASARYAYGNQKTAQSFADNVKLPKVELENYAQYGLGLEKQTKDYAFNVFAQYNDDGRTGWTGSIRYSWFIN